MLVTPEGLILLYVVSWVKLKGKVCIPAHLKTRRLCSASVKNCRTSSWWDISSFSFWRTFRVECENLEVIADANPLFVFVYVFVQFVWHRPRSEQCAAASHEPVCPDQHGGRALPLHHLHAHRNQVRVRLKLVEENSPGGCFLGLRDVTFPSLLATLKRPELHLCQIFQSERTSQYGTEMTLRFYNW